MPSTLKGALVGSSPLAEKNNSSLSNGQTARENAGHSEQERLGDQNVLTSFSESESVKPVYVELNDGMGSVLVHRVVPDDNSCLFSAIGLVLKGHYDASITKELRQGMLQPLIRLQSVKKCFLSIVVVDDIRKDPINFSDAMLG